MLKYMELMSDTIRAGAIFHYTDIGRFYEEVIRYATEHYSMGFMKHSDKHWWVERALKTISVWL